MALQPVAKANKLSKCEGRAGGDCSRLGGGLRLSRGTLGGFGLWCFSGSFPCWTPVFCQFNPQFSWSAHLGPPIKQRTVWVHCLSWPADETKNRLSPLPLAVCLNSGWLPRYRFHCGPRSSALVNATKAPRKSGLGPLFGVMRTRASLAKSGASWWIIGLVGCDGCKLCPKFSASGF